MRVPTLFLEQLREVTAATGLSEDEVILAALYEAPDRGLEDIKTLADGREYEPSGLVSSLMASLAPDMGLTTSGLALYLARMMPKAAKCEIARRGRPCT